MNIEQKIIPKLPLVKTVENRHIIIHDVGNPGSTLDNNVNYFHDNWNIKETFVTHIIDDKRVVQIAPVGYISWGAGNVNPFAYAQIEMVNVSPDKFANQVELLGELLKKLCQDSGIPGYFTGQKSKGIMTHKQASLIYGGSDHYDPDSYVTGCGWSMDKFRNRISEIINSSKSQTNPDLQNEKPMLLKDFTEPIPVNAFGIAWVSNISGALLYDNEELTKPTTRVLEYKTKWILHKITDKGSLDVGNQFIKSKDALIKLNYGKLANDFKGMTAVIDSDDCYTQNIPEPGQKGLQYLPKNAKYAIFNQSKDNAYLDLGSNQWVDSNKLKIEP